MKSGPLYLRHSTLGRKSHHRHSILGWRKPKATYSVLYRDFFMERSSSSVSIDHPTNLACRSEQDSRIRSVYCERLNILITPNFG